MDPVQLILLGFGVLAVLLIAGYLVARRRTAEGAERSQLQVRFMALAFLLLLAFTGFQHWRIQDLMSETSVIEKFHWLWYYKPDTWREQKWAGVPVGQQPLDTWIHQEIISEVQPDVIVETGTWKGGSALIWAMILNQFKPDGRVVTVDLYDHGIEAKKLPAWKNVDFIQGSSTDPKVVEDIRKRIEGKKALFILDSVHSKEHVLAELAAYAPMVPVGSYIIVQDCNLNGHPVLPNTGPGPMEAVEEFLSKNDQFTSDRSRERFLFTFCPKGYLKRVK